MGQPQRSRKTPANVQNLKRNAEVFGMKLSHGVETPAPRADGVPIVSIPRRRAEFCLCQSKAGEAGADLVFNRGNLFTGQSPAQARAGIGGVIDQAGALRHYGAFNVRKVKVRIHLRFHCGEGWRDYLPAEGCQRHGRRCAAPWLVPPAPALP